MGCFKLFIITRQFQVIFKTHAASFLNGFQNIPGKACVKRVHNNDAFVNVGNQHTRKTLNTAY